MFNIEDIEDIRNYFNPIPETGTQLPNAKDVPDWTIFWLLSGGVYIEHIMFKNAWHKKIVDSNSQVVLEKV